MAKKLVVLGGANALLVVADDGIVEGVISTASSGDNMRVLFRFGSLCGNGEPGDHSHWLTVGYSEFVVSEDYKKPLHKMTDKQAVALIKKGIKGIESGR